jgi:hypothetical protein
VSSFGIHRILISFALLQRDIDEPISFETIQRSIKNDFYVVIHFSNILLPFQGLSSGKPYLFSKVLN